MHFFGLDTETTGLSPHDDRVIDLGIVEVVGGQEGFEYSKQFNPGRSISPDATRVHGYTNAMLADKPPIKAELMGVLAMLAGQVLVGHNLGFDLDMLDAECERNGLPTLRSVIGGTHDTYAMAKTAWPGKTKDLSSVCRKCKVSLVSERKLHGALIDAKLSARCFLVMNQIQNPMFVETVANVVHKPTVSSLAARLALPVWRANAEESANHVAYLSNLEIETKSRSIWNGGPAAKVAVVVATAPAQVPTATTQAGTPTLVLTETVGQDCPPPDYDPRAAGFIDCEDPSVETEDFETLEAMAP